MTEFVYEVRRSRIRIAFELAAYSIVPVGVMVVGLMNWSEAWQFFVIGLLAEAIAISAVIVRIRSALRRELLFGVDVDGVLLGRDEKDRPAMREPWSRIDELVYFDARIRRSHGMVTVRHVGVVRGGRIVNFRAVEGWSLDVGRAERAVTRYGGGVRLLQAPVQNGVPDQWFVAIPLPAEWRTWSA